MKLKEVKKMKRNLIISFTLIFLAMLILSSYAVAQDELTMWARTPETIELLEDSAEVYMENNPDVKIEIIDFPADDYPGALQAAITGDDLPDIFHTHSSVPLPRLRELNLVQPIEEHFSEGFIDKFDEGTWLEGSTTLDNEVYAWPDRTFRRASLFMYYNKEVLEAAGLDSSSPPENWDELIYQGRKVNEETGQFGLHLGFTSGWFNERVVLQLATTVEESTGVPSEHFEGSYINWAEGDMFDYESILPVMDLFKDLEENNAIHPNYLTAGRAEATAQWAAGQAAFLIDGSWRLQEIISDYEEEYDLDFGIKMLPGKELDTAYWGVEGGSPNSFVVSESSENVELAADFFEFLTEDYYPKLIENSIDLTPVPEINEDDTIDSHPLFAELIELTDEGTKIIPSPQLENSDELETISNFISKSASEPLGSTFQGYLADEDRDIEEYLQDYSAEQQEFLEESLTEAKEEGYEVDVDNWIYEDWDKAEDYIH